jgi:pimeloyl-ACP methyl ester carboxylesterase
MPMSSVPPSVLRKPATVLTTASASYEVIGSGRPALMFAGGPGFSATYMNGDAELLSDAMCSYLIDPHGSGSSTPPANPAEYSAEGHARFYEEVRQAFALPPVVVLGHSFGATTALTYAALFPDRTATCVAVAAFGIGPDADAQRAGPSTSPNPTSPRWRQDLPS